MAEAPGEDEAKQGKPFVGRSGKYLMQLLAGVGLTREQLFITNVVKERPPNNNIGKFLTFPSKGPPKMTEEYLQYESLLKTELGQTGANVLVATGRVSLWALTRQLGILKWRGSVLESTLLPGRKVIPIIHPAAALREYLLTYFIQHDLEKVVVESEYPEFRFAPRRYVIRPSFDQSVGYLDQLAKRPRIAFDIETSRGDPQVTCISFAYNESEAISIPFTEAGNNYFTPEQELEIWRRIASVLSNPNQIHIGQNVMFDASFLHRRYGIIVSNLEDTMIAMGILYPDFRKGLDVITSLYTDLPYYKDDGKARHAGKGVRDEDYWVYNARDSIVCMEAWPTMIDELTEQGNLETYQRQRRLHHPFLYTMEHGMRVDHDVRNRTLRQIKKRLDQLLIEFNRVTEIPVSPTSPQQLAAYFYGHLGIDPIKNRKTGKPTTDEKALKRLATGTSTRKPRKEAQILLEFRKLDKLRGTYFEVDFDPDMRLRGIARLAGTKGARISSGKTIFHTGVNVQTLPPIAKKYVTPDEGYVAYEVDLSQAENRIVAYLGPDHLMIDAFESGIDIHSRTASLIFGIDEGLIAEMDKVFGKTKDASMACQEIGGGRYTHRFWGKKANHGLNYDLGFRSFGYIYEILEKEAKLIVDRYHQAYPGVRAYHRMIKAQLAKDRTLTTLMGRKRTFLDRFSDEMHKDAYSYIPQSTVGDKLNEHGFLYIYENQHLFHEVELLNQVHDSIVFQIPLEVPWARHAEILETLRASLEQPLTYLGRTFTIPADTKLLRYNLAEGVELKGSITALRLDEAYASAFQDLK